MIRRNVRGRGIQIPRALPGTVVAASEHHVELAAADGESLILTRDSRSERARSVVGILAPLPYEVGDVLLVDPSGGVELLFRPSWVHNSILVTERCDSRCVMCSQPPREVDDSPRIETLIEAVGFLPETTRSVGITGGEPSLLGSRLVALVDAIKSTVPDAGIHLLSNGRGFRQLELARSLGQVGCKDLMVGVPLYADHDELHDRVVGAKGAFEEALRGIENLARSGVPIEIRVVLHRMTVTRLEALCHFIYRNMPYVSQVALMGLEPIGYAVPNLESLWVDPLDYAPALTKSVETLVVRNIRTLIYNAQLCTLPSELWPHAPRSISDWKNEYLPECEACSRRDDCCGFFSSAVTRRVVSRGIAAISAQPSAPHFQHETR